MQLWKKVVIGLVLGIIFGYLVNTGSIPLEFLNKYIKPVGTIFINLIKMIIVPLIFLAIISGITSIEDKSSLGRIGSKSVMAYLTTSAFAVVIGLVAANLLHPGLGISDDLISKLTTSKGAVPVPDAKVPSALDTLLDIVPTNAIGAMAQGHVLQVVFFAIFTGITINLMGDDSKRISNGCSLLAKLVFKMIGLIVQLSPYAVFALIAVAVGTQGIDILKNLAMLVVTVVAACVFQYILFGILIAVIGRISPFPFFRKSLEYQALAFSTSSSKATLPTTMDVARSKIGISEQSTSFVLPLGAAINMDGTAIYLGICTVFLAQATGTPLGMHEYGVIILLSTLASIGAAGIPSGSLIMMGMVLSAVGLPLEGIAIIAGVDRVLDMLRTTINITGDTAITLIIDKSENKLDVDKYYS